ncbi:MAG: hypothetical protein HN742_01445 [Lentisphaerae bacterium]|jgi:hypothetical protein|nr:hypothetical protein [Lentisphaerota bacterium]MBT5609775.1 hypothetical protein [Lentisphaerota bacterium]MBT7054024.1 hypothetical protein [Lentisphaerota bacterium]MBT7840499.1 hypothetical protein [Lentisphaerota bacterium]
MYPLSPPTIVVLDRALEDPFSARRVERMLAALGTDLSSVIRAGDDEIPELIRTNGWHDARLRQGRVGPHADPALVFSTLLFDDQPTVEPVLRACPPGTSARLVENLLGYGGRGVAKENFTSSRGVCRARVQFDTIFGCPHGCKYCAGGKVAVVNTNLEEFLEKQVKPAAEQETWQKVFMYNSCLSDTPCFEPEYGLSKLLAEYYATTPDQHYLIHTKSANVDFLRDVDHRGRTIMLWSLANHTASKLVEPGSALPEERIEAARICQEMGYPIRFKLKPIVPVRDWRTQYSQIITHLFERTTPESIGLFMLAWMDFEEFRATIDLDLIDPPFVTALEEGAETMRGVTAGPFPHRARAEVYHFLLEEVRKHNRDVPVFLCTETLEMWQEFSPLLGMKPNNYICACGPQCMPGMTRIPKVEEPLELRG